MGLMEVVRYDADLLHAELGANFQLISSSRDLHGTPWGATQQFLYCHYTLQ
jgi:hypothetical protein